MNWLYNSNACYKVTSVLFYASVNSIQCLVTLIFASAFVHWNSDAIKHVHADEISCKFVNLPYKQTKFIYAYAILYRLYSQQPQAKLRLVAICACGSQFIYSGPVESPWYSSVSQKFWYPRICSVMNEQTFWTAAANASRKKVCFEENLANWIT